MTGLVTLAVLEVAVLECKKRDVNTTEVRAALDLLEPYIRPTWLIPQFRHHALGEATDSPGDREGQQQVLRVTFPGIRDSVRVLLEVRMDRLALKFYETKDLKVRDEIYRLSRELIKLDEPWRFVVIEGPNLIQSSFICALEVGSEKVDCHIASCFRFRLRRKRSFSLSSLSRA
jgi:hypothetical protein